MYDLIAERKPYHPWIPTQQLWNCFYEMHTFKKILSHKKLKKTSATNQEHPTCRE